jgi:hypothetical protein
MERYGVRCVLQLPEFQLAGVKACHTLEAESKRQATFLERFGGHPMQNPAIRKKTTAAWLETIEQRYGGNLHNDATIHEKTQRSRLRDYALPSGKIIQLQGYEPQVLSILLGLWGFSEDDFEFNRTLFPEVHYLDPSDNRKRRYHPDFFIPKLNLILEVKSAYTFLQGERNLAFPTNLAKAAACLALGYEYEWMVWDPKAGDIIELNP